MARFYGLAARSGRRETMNIYENYLPMLQLFAEGGDGGAKGQAAGDTAADAGRQSKGETLKALGVPESVLNRKKAVIRSLDKPQSGKTSLSKEGANTPQSGQSKNEAPKTETKTKPSWEELMQDTDYNRQMQATVQSRLKNAMGAKESLSKIAPVLELMGKSYGMDSKNMDYAALADAIRGDSRFQFAAGAAGANNEVGAENAAGVQIAAGAAGATNEANTEKDTPAPDMMQLAQMRQRAKENLNSLLAQAEALKATIPGFKLEKELQNPMFVKLTAPETGLSVEDAYFALHRREIQSAAVEAAARQTAERLSKAVMSGSKRPLEAGTTLQAPSRIGFDYSKASPEEKTALKERIRSAALRGEKLYPN